MQIGRVGLVLACLLLTLGPGAAASAQECVERILVLGAMPLEVQPLVYAATIDEVVRVDEKTFYVGELSERDVVIAMTGIGMVNAEQTVDAAFKHFCKISSIVFSGVAGSRYSIGDVSIPERWTIDDGETWLLSDPAMVEKARTLVGWGPLLQAVPVGDDACVCPGVDTIESSVTLEHTPQVRVGGDGTTSDTYGGKALPCVPGGGDVFGCQVCAAPGSSPDDIANFAVNAPDYASEEFIRDFFQAPAATTDTYVSQDQESGAAASAAQRHGAPFLAIRAASDGEGDPLNLPGFPFQFFAYRHLAGQNAALVTIEFLRIWDVGSSSPGGVAAPDNAAPRDAASDGDSEDGAPLPITGGGASLLGALLLVAGLGRRASQR